MTYDFNKIIDRTNTDSVKWDWKKGMLPMWVADMDFEAFPGIKKALSDRVDHGIFGYTIISDAWVEAYQYWWKKRHSFEIEKEWIVFVSGVIPAISAAIRMLSDSGDNVLIQAPVYPAFFSTIKKNGRNVLENKLIYDRENSKYSIDWDDLEAKLSDPKTKLMILCNPQNPSGNIWDVDTLKRIGDLCKENDVIVLSDEIHCDIVAPGKGYIPFASVSETNRSISATFISPTKTFNIAGIQTAAVVVPDLDLLKKIEQGIDIAGVNEGNCFAYEVVKAAYTEEGENWLDQLREYIWNNRIIAEEYICKNIKSIKAIPSDASYLMWVDCSDVIDDSNRFVIHLEKEAGLMLNSGKSFGDNGDTFVRVNLACPVGLLNDGLERLKKGVESYS